ncbi:fliH protein [Clostridium sp.]|uniref:FliH/SctL family protein n=1 Tax=Clostridium sp. TaxID=1506 RepID=UPI0039F48C1B
MLSSYKVIKNQSIIEKGKKEINTEYVIEKNKELGEKNAKDFIESYEVLARTMLENARRQSDEILASAYSDAQRIGQEAYEKGYSEGEISGREEGIAKANTYYEEVKDRTEKECEVLKKNADKILYSAKQEYIRYMKEKQEEIKRLIISITEGILKREIKDKDGITSMVLDAVEAIVKSKTIIVRCNSIYIEDLKEKLEVWKNRSVFRGEVFVVPDDNLEEGNAEIQRENGKIVVSVTEAIKKVKEIIETS